MATTLNRGSTWTNSDGLIVGFGTNSEVVEGGSEKCDNGGGYKSRSVTFEYTDTGVNVPVPAGAEIVGVKLKVDEAFAGGTAVLVGDGSDPDGFITATAGALAKLVAGALINADGLYTSGTTDATAREFKLYASADTIDLSYSGTFTAGKATLVVNYI
jgi:hypothetical protein